MNRKNNEGQGWKRAEEPWTDIFKDKKKAWRNEKQRTRLKEGIPAKVEGIRKGTKRKKEAEAEYYNADGSDRMKVVAKIMTETSE